MRLYINIAIKKTKNKNPVLRNLPLQQLTDFLEFPGTSQWGWVASHESQKRIKIQQFFPTASSFLSSSWFPWDGELSCSLTCVGDDFKKNTSYYLSFKQASQKNCYTNPKFQFSNFYCQEVLKWINFLFKEKDLDNTEGTERLSPTAANFHEYTILFKHSRQSQQQRNAVTPVKPGELDQLTLHQIRIWPTKKICCLETSVIRSAI